MDDARTTASESGRMVEVRVDGELVVGRLAAARGREGQAAMTYTVELSWREHGVYTVEADNRDDAISAAMIQAGRDSVNDPQHFDVEAVSEGEA